MGAGAGGRDDPDVGKAEARNEQPAEPQLTTSADLRVIEFVAAYAH